MQKKKVVSVWHKISSFIVDLVKDTITYPQTCKRMLESKEQAKKILHENTKEEYKKAHSFDAKAFEQLTTTKEKILFFYRYFKKQNVDKAIERAYAAVYLIENTDSFKNEELGKLSFYLNGGRDTALLKTKVLLSNDRDYIKLINPTDENPLSDEYKFQCLGIAVCSDPMHRTNWPYFIDLLEKPKKSPKN